MCFPPCFSYVYLRVVTVCKSNSSYTFMGLYPHWCGTSMRINAYWSWSAGTLVELPNAQYSVWNIHGSCVKPSEIHLQISVIESYWWWSSWLLNLIDGDRQGYWILLMVIDGDCQGYWWFLMVIFYLLFVIVHVSLSVQLVCRFHGQDSCCRVSWVLAGVGASLLWWPLGADLVVSPIAGDSRKLHQDADVSCNP
jgi:hypothetical protein